MIGDEVVFYCVCSMYMYCMFVCVHMPSHTDEQGHVPQLRGEKVSSELVACTNLAVSVIVTVSLVYTTHRRFKVNLGITHLLIKLQKKAPSRHTWNLSTSLSRSSTRLLTSNIQRIEIVRWQILTIHPGELSVLATQKKKKQQSPCSSNYQHREKSVLEIITEQADIL